MLTLSWIENGILFSVCGDPKSLYRIAIRLDSCSIFENDTELTRDEFYDRILAQVEKESGCVN